MYLQKVETGNIVNIYTIKQEREVDKLDKMDDTKGETNPYYEIVTNTVEKDDVNISQMEQWSILSNVVNYVQYDRHPKDYYDLDIKAVNLKSHKKIYNKEEKRQMSELDFGDTQEKLKENI